MDTLSRVRALPNSGPRLGEIVSTLGHTLAQQWDSRVTIYRSESSLEAAALGRTAVATLGPPAKPKIWASDPGHHTMSNQKCPGLLGSPQEREQRISLFLMSQDEARLSQGGALAESHRQEVMDLKKPPTHGAPWPGASALVTLNLAAHWNHDGSCGPTPEILENLACVLRSLKPPEKSNVQCREISGFETVPHDPVGPVVMSGSGKPVGRGSDHTGGAPHPQLRPVTAI